MSTITGYLWGIGLGVIIEATTISPSVLTSIMVGIMVILIAMLTWLLEMKDSQSLKERKQKEVTK